MRLSAVAVRVALAALLLAATDSCAVDENPNPSGEAFSFRTPCSEAQLTVARQVSHPKGLTLHLARDEYGACLSPFPERDAQAVVSYYKRTLPARGWVSWPGGAGAKYVKGGMRFAVRFEQDVGWYISITKRAPRLVDTRRQIGVGPRS